MLRNVFLTFNVIHLKMANVSQGYLFCFSMNICVLLYIIVVWLKKTVYFLLTLYQSYTALHMLRSDGGSSCSKQL